MGGGKRKVFVRAAAQKKKLHRHWGRPKLVGRTTLKIADENPQSNNERGKKESGDRVSMDRFLALMENPRHREGKVKWLI